MSENQPINEVLPDLIPRIRSVVTRYAGPVDVDDLTQECCVRLIEKEHLYRKEKGHLKNWVDQIVRRLTISKRKREARRRDVEANLEYQGEDEKANFSTERIEWLLSQLAGLPSPLKEVIQLRYYEELSVAQVGDRLGISQPAASKRLRKALDELSRRARLQGWLSSFLPYGLSFKMAGISKAKLYTSFAASSAAAATACGFFLPFEDTYLIEETSALPRTTMVATLKSPLNENQNTIWSATSVLAWQALQQKVGGPLTFKRPVDVANRLNQAPDVSQNLSKNSYLACAGHVSEEFLEDTQKKLEKLFGRGRDPFLDHHITSPEFDELMTYSFLSKELTFENPFEVLEDKALTFRSSDGQYREVKTFGIHDFHPRSERHQKIIEQAEINYAISAERDEDSSDEITPASYIVTLKPEQNEEIILAQIPPETTLEETINEVMRKVSLEKKIILAEGSSLKIPKIDYHLTHQFSQLYSNEILNPGYENWELSMSVQTIAFKLDEKGVVLRSRSFMVIMSKMIKFSRDIIFNRPFLLLLKEKEATQPYFAMWISNPEILIPNE